MKKSMKSFDAFDHNFTLEEHLDQIDAAMFFDMVEHTLKLVDFNQWYKQKLAYKQC